MATQKNISFKMTDEQMEKLKKLAQDRDMSLSEFISTAIEMYYLIESNVDESSEVFIHNPKDSKKDLIIPTGKYALV